MKDMGWMIMVAVMAALIVAMVCFVKYGFENRRHRV